jgi:hypothetical protein
MKNRPTTPIDLDYSITVDGVEVSSLTMSRPTVADQLAFEDGKGSEAHRTVLMMANLCDVPPGSIREMDGSDFDKLVEVLQGFKKPRQESLGDSVCLSPS